MSTGWQNVFLLGNCDSSGYEIGGPPPLAVAFGQTSWQRSWRWLVVHRRRTEHRRSPEMMSMTMTKPSADAAYHLVVQRPVSLRLVRKRRHISFCCSKLECAHSRHAGRCRWCFPRNTCSGNSSDYLGFCVSRNSWRTAITPPIRSARSPTSPIRQAHSRDGDASRRTRARARPPAMRTPGSPVGPPTLLQLV